MDPFHAILAANAPPTRQRQQTPRAGTASPSLPPLTTTTDPLTAGQGYQPLLTGQWAPTPQQGTMPQQTTQLDPATIAAALAGLTGTQNQQQNQGIIGDVGGLAGSAMPQQQPAAQLPPSQARAMAMQMGEAQRQQQMAMVQQFLQRQYGGQS